MKQVKTIGRAVILSLLVLLTAASGQVPRHRITDQAKPTDPELASKPQDSSAKTDEPKKTDQAESETDDKKPNQDKAEAEKKKPDQVPVAFKGMTVEKIASFLSEKLKKPVLVVESIKGKKITIVSKEKMPLDEALYLIRQALLAEGVIVEQLPKLVRIRPVEEVMQSALVRVSADKSVATIPDQLQIVTKEFLITHYDVSKMVDVIQPLLSGFAHIMADPDIRKLAVSDSVGNLLRIEQVIAGMDVPLAQRTLTEIIILEDGDATEIIGIVRWLIAGRMGIDVKEITTAAGGKRDSGRSSKPRGGRPRPGTKDGQGPQIVVTKIESSKSPVTLVPHISRNWIIAVAPPELMGQIKVWVKQLDKPREVEKDYEWYEVKHADVADLAEQIRQALGALPSELRETTQVVPFGRSKKLIVFGSKTGRELAMGLLEKIDREDAEKRDRKTFVLKHADAEEMAQRIETLFSQMEVAGKSSYYRRTYTYYRRSAEATKVTVVPDKRRNAITVITDPDTMKEIEELIKEEDIPITAGEVKPKVYELKYADPAEIQELLTEMFSGQDSGGSSFWDYYFGRNRRQVTPVGRLLGQFTFQVLPSSNKLIVNTKSIANYEVIDALIAELDQPQRAGLPLIIELKYANAEDLCEQLNAMLAEPGTLAKIRRAERGLSDYHRQSARTNDASSASGSSRNDGQADANMTEFWWEGFRRPEGRTPASNMIGKIRFVPVYRRNALMVLTPAAFSEPIQELVEMLDQPGRQVVIYGRIGEIQHDDQTSLGLRLASDPSILAPVDSALGGSAGIDFSNMVFSGTTVISAKTNVSLLLNLLIREFGMKVLLEPSLVTSDNEAAEFFDGSDVPVITELRGSAEGTSTITNFDYQEVGTRLRIRPHITTEGSVDLMINLEISRIVPGSASQGGNPTFDRREVTTHVILEDGQTVMLSGIIRQDKFEDVRKWPLLGDLPLIGWFFRAVETGIGNRELVIFITPRVMTTAAEVDTEMKKPLGVLQRIEKSMGSTGKKDQD